MAKPTWAELVAAGLDTDCTLALLLNDGSGTTAADASGNGNAGTLVGAAGGWVLSGSSDPLMNDTYNAAGNDGAGNPYFLGVTNGYTIQEVYGYFWGVWSSYQAYPSYGTWICYTYDPLSGSSSWSGTTPPGTTAAGSPVYPTWTTDVDGDGALALGAGQYVQIADAADLRPTSAFSWFALVSATALPGAYNCIYSKVASNGLYLRSDGKIGVYLATGSSDGAGTFVMPTDGTRHSIAVTFDAAHIKVYVDGTLDSTTTVSGALSTDTNSPRLGQDVTGSYQFPGLKVSELDMWLSALTSGEVTTLQGMCAGVTTYTASGTVSGDATSGILLTATCTGQTNVTTTSGGGGTYTLTGLVAGDWTITPTLAGYTFAPTTADANITSSDVTGKDFVATAVGGGGPALPILVQYYRRLRSK